MQAVLLEVPLTCQIGSGATTYIGDTALTAPPFFDNAIRVGTILWGARASGTRVID